MGRKVLFDGVIYTEPVSKARIIGGVSNAGSPASFGNICIIDDGLGATWGGGKGVFDESSVARQFDDFVNVLSEADAIVLTDIYSAGEAPIDGIDSRALCQSIRARGKVDPVLISDSADIVHELPSMLLAGDLVLLLGAGNIGLVAEQIRDRGFATEEAA